MFLYPPKIHESPKRKEVREVETAVDLSFLEKFNVETTTHCCSYDFSLSIQFQLSPCHQLLVRLPVRG